MDKTYRFRKFVPNQYEILANSQENSVVIYLLNRELRRVFRTPMLFSYDGKMWIKTAGGRAVRFEKLVEVLGLDEETIRLIKIFFGGWNWREHWEENN